VVKVGTNHGKVRKIMNKTLRNVVLFAGISLIFVGKSSQAALLDGDSSAGNFPTLESHSSVAKISASSGQTPYFVVDTSDVNETKQGLGIGSLNADFFSLADNQPLGSRYDTHYAVAPIPLVDGEDGNNRKFLLLTFGALLIAGDNESNPENFRAGGGGEGGVAPIPELSTGILAFLSFVALISFQMIVKRKKDSQPVVATLRA
jgi:hypothetical protein